MALPQVPAYLQVQSSREAINEAARQAVGASLPPHISIRGNRFTAIDAAGNQFDLGITMQAVVIDVSPVVCKMFFDPEKPWTPDSDDPPLCWSTNGVGPSVNAIEPQARTCAECNNNARGSAVSKISGASIKACRDETHLALLFPQAPTMIFRYVVTPGSFKNWGAYLDSIKGVKLQDLITQFDFVPQSNGEVQFLAPAFMPEELLAVREQAYAEKKTDVIVGRNDRPRIGLPAPAAQGQIATHGLVAEAGHGQGTAPLTIAPLQQVQQPDPFANATTAATTPASTVAPSAAPSSNVPRRRGRPAAQPAAAQTPTAAPQQGGFTPGPAPGPQAPFRQANGAQPTTSAGTGFGIAQAAAPNSELSGMLNTLFGKPAA